MTDFTINGRKVSIGGQDDSPLLWVIRDEVGLTPKLFARITRFRRIIDSLQGSRQIHWSGLALECGYFDQAHFIHDFRAFAGISPAAYLQHRMSSNHVRIAE